VHVINHVIVLQNGGLRAEFRVYLVQPHVHLMRRSDLRMLFIDNIAQVLNRCRLKCWQIYRPDQSRIKTQINHAFLPASVV
jgi:hypothetical protein